jgi:predicted ferric reductase
VAVFGSILAWRVGWPLWFNARHRLRVERVTPEARSTVSIHLCGRALRDLEARPGQFFLWRFLTRDGWWQAHPFSLSAAASPRELRITVKDVGDHTRALQHLKPGTQVFAEGPYGTFTAERRRRPRVLLIAGGIGITPLRALLDELGGDARGVTLVYRVIGHEDVAFARELDRLATDGKLELHILSGSDIGDDQTDQLGVPALARLVPDLRRRDVFVCGPPGLIDAVCPRLRRLGVPRRQIHFERFEF